VPSRPVYLDNHATTRTDPRVVAEMLPFFTEIYGNAASAGHCFGWEAADALERARGRVASLIGAEPREVVFTSGATEANNLAIKGVLPPAPDPRGGHLVTAATEHRAVLDPLKRLAREGWTLSVVPPDRTGLINAEAIAGALTDRTALVSVMLANNELGTINPVREIAGHCRTHGVLFHTDATQAVGKIPVDVRDLGADLLSFSAHKFYGPKGIGALYVRRDGPPMRLRPLVDGGGHERGLRSGTVPVPLAVGLGAAAEIAGQELGDDAGRILGLRERLHAAIVSNLEGVRLNGHPTRRLPGSLNLSFDGVDGHALTVALLRDVAVSTGSACSSVNPGPSHVLRAIGLDESLAAASLRFGLGRFTTAEEVDRAAGSVVEAVGRLRKIGAATGAGGRPGV